MSATVETQTKVDPCPTIADARALTKQIIDLPDVVAVYLFGSVAKGDAKPGSDIDLLVVIKDLEYNQRSAWSNRISGIVWKSAGMPCDAVIRSLAEWQGRKSLSSSLEQHVIQTGLTMYEDVRTIKDWVSSVASNSNGKGAWALGNTDLVDAIIRLEEVSQQLNRLARDLYPDAKEIDQFVSQAVYAEWEDEPSEEKTIWIVCRKDRYLELLYHCERIIESSLKSLHHSLRGKYPQRTHSIGQLADNLPNGSTKERAKAIIDPLRVSHMPVEHRGSPSPPSHESDFVNWREEATYIGDRQGGFYLPTSRVKNYLYAAEEIAELALGNVLSEPGGTELLKREMPTRDLSAQIKELAQFNDETDLETGGEMSVADMPDVDKLLRFFKTKRGQFLMSDEQADALFESRIPRSKLTALGIAPETLNTRTGICGVVTRAGAPCKHPRPALAGGALQGI